MGMDVKDKAGPLSTVRNLMARQHGSLFTSDLAKLGIPRTYLSILENRGEVHRVSRGVYAAADTLADEMAGLQARYKAAIFSHETALYLWDLTDRSPLSYSVTVPSGYHAPQLKASGANVYFIRRDLHPFGRVVAKSPHGNAIQTYDLERTICDVLRSRNQVEVQFVTQALQRYVRRQDKNLDRLNVYAGRFGIQKIVRAYIEVLL
jgi:predicted transcriptional regulator of viral defense system